MVMLALLAATTLYTANLRGTIASIDSRHREVVVRRRRQKGDNMDPRVLVRIDDARWFRTLRVGQRVDLRCDESQALIRCVRAPAPTG